MKKEKVLLESLKGSGYFGIVKQYLSEQLESLEDYAELISDMLSQKGDGGIYYSPSTDIYLYEPTDPEDLDALEDAGWSIDTHLPAKVGKHGQTVEDVKAFGNIETAKKFLDDLRTGRYQKYKYRNPLDSGLVKEYSNDSPESTGMSREFKRKFVEAQKELKSLGLSLKIVKVEKDRIICQADMEAGEYDDILTGFNYSWLEDNDDQEAQLEIYFN